MESHSHADDIITLPSDSQSGTPATSAAPLFVECPGTCKRRIALESIDLAGKSESSAVWTCSSCSQIQKNKLRLGGITWCVFSALTQMVKPASLILAQEIVLPNELWRKKKGSGTRLKT